MLLHDIGKSPDTTFKKINQHLENNYGFKISENTSDKDLISIMEQIEDEISGLKIKGNDSKSSAEISKRLLVLEGIRSLMEFSDVQFKSPKLDTVVKNLADYVVDTFEISGKDSTDYERAVERAMDEYRSSRYRFPDDYIEQLVRQDSMMRLVPAPEMGMMESNVLTDGLELSDPYRTIGKRASASGGHAAEVPNTPVAKHAMSVLDNPELSLQDTDAETNDIPMVVHPRTGKLVPDPFAAHAAERKKGISMKEHTNLVKNLRRLLETEVSQAEVMMAAKGFAQELQEMVEKIGRLQNEDLPPVTDQMRETYGTDSASAFQTQIYGALQGVMDSLYTAKQQVDDAVSNMASTGQVLAQTDMDKTVDDMGAMAGDIPDDLDNIAADLDNMGDEELGDEFGAEDSEEPLGRSLKMESVLRNKVTEMQRLVEKARKLKESRK